MPPTLPSIDYSGGIMKSFDTPSYLPAKKPVAIPKAITPSPEPSVYEDKGWADQYRQDLKDFYQGTDVNNPMTSGLYQTLAPHEATIENLGQTTQETAQRSKELGKNITSGAQQLGDIIQGAPDVEGAKKQGKYLSQDELNTKISGLMEAMPDATDEEIATALKQMQDEGHIFEGINDKQGMVDVASQGGLAPYRQALGGAVKAFGSGVGGLTSGYGSAMEGAGNIGAGDTNLGISQVAKGAGETAGGVLTGAFPVASTVMNTSAFQATPLQAGLEKFGEGANYVAGKGVELAGGDLSTETGKNYQQAGSTAIQLGAIPLGLKGLKVAGKSLPGVTSSVGEMAGKVGETVIPIANKAGEIAGKVSDFVSKKNESRAKAIGDKGVEEIYQAVNPTTRENKAVLRQRVNDLLPYIEEKNIFNNELPKVKERVDADMKKAFDNMENYESTVGVKGKVETKPIIDALKEKYQEKVGDSYLNPDEAMASQKVIDLLQGFGKELKDADILKVRRAWDNIIKGNKGFMQSAEANIKGEVFNESNKFLRDEIRKSNPEYAEFLDKAHKTITLSDVLDATIQRRTGQTQGGFLRQGLENVSRVVGTGIGGAIGGGAGALIGAGATEALITGTKKLTGSSAKLTKGKNLILKSEKYGTSNNNIPNSSSTSVVAESKQLTKGPGLKALPSTIPGSSKTTVEVPSNPLGNVSKTLAGKQGVMVEPKPEIKLLPSGEKYKQSQVKTIEQELNTALQSKYNPNKPEATKKFIDSAIEQGKISKEQGIAIVQKLYENANGFDKPHYEKIIKELSSGKTTSFEDLISEKPAIPTTKEQTPREMFDKLNQMANDGRYGEKSWNDLADKFKQKTGKDIMDTGHDDFAPNGSIKTPPTTLPKQKESVVVAESKKNLPIVKKEGTESKPVLPANKTPENLTPKKESANMGDMETKIKAKPQNRKVKPNKTTNEQQGITTKSIPVKNPLVEEARKYNTAEEFEKALRSPRGIGYGGNMGILWRATSKPFKPNTKTIIEHGITDSGDTKSYAKDILLSNDYGKSEPYLISKDAKIASWREGNDVYKVTKESAFSKKSVEEFKRRGFDGFERGPDEIVIFNENKIKPFNINDFFTNYIK